MDWRKIDKAAIFNGKDENGNRYLSQFLRDYKETFHPDMINAGCSKCLEDYYLTFIKYLSNMSKKENTGYKLKEKYNGIPLEFGSAVYVSNANLTDELAEKLIKKHPAGKDLFDAVPETKASSKSSKKEPAKDPAQEKTRSEELNAMKRDELDALATKLELNPADYSNKELISEAIEKQETAKKSSEGKE